MTGRETEDRALDVLQHHGYQTYQPPKAKYREQDVYGISDILAFGHGHELRVQVKGGRKAAGINEWAEQARVMDEHLDDIRHQLWHRKDDS